MRDAPDHAPLAPPPAQAPLAAALSAFFIALTLYLITAVALDHLENPGLAYFDRLAASFLAGRLDLPHPEPLSDLTFHNGRWYVPFPPLPALLMTPFVALFGGVRVVPFSICLGAIAVAATLACIRTLQRHGRLPTNTRSAHLAAISLAGGVLWFCCVDGQVWFLGQVCAIAMFALAAWAASAGRNWYSGLFLALAVCGRPHVLLGLPLLLALPPCNQPRAPLRTLPRRALPTLLPCVVAIAALGAYNHARFNSPFDSGYLRQEINPILRADLSTYGQFNTHFLPRNLWLMTIKPPAITLNPPRIHPDFIGIGMLWTLPAIVLLLASPRWMRYGVARAAALAATLISIPLLLYYNGGWAQFGYRFSLDFLVPLTICLAAAIAHAPPAIARALVGAGVIVNGWGVYCWFTR